MLALGAAIVMLVGCAGDDGAAARPTTLATPTASSGGVGGASTATPSPTTSKEQARRDVEAAVRAYYAAMEKAVQTGDTTTFDASVHEGCRCRHFSEQVSKAFETTTTRGAKLHLGKPEVISLGREYATVQITYKSDAHQILDAEGVIQRHVPARAAHDNIALIKVSGRWLVTDVADLTR